MTFSEDARHEVGVCLVGVCDDKKGDLLAIGVEDIQDDVHRCFRGVVRCAERSFHVNGEDQWARGGVFTHSRWHRWHTTKFLVSAIVSLWSDVYCTHDFLSDRSVVRRVRRPVHHERGAVRLLWPSGVMTRLTAWLSASSLLSGTLMLFLGAVVTGVINYAFNIVMAREGWLGPADYGTLAALTSVLYLVGITGTTISTVVAKYTASFVASGEHLLVGQLIRSVRTRLYRYGVPVLLLLAGSSMFIARFLRIEGPAPVLWLIPLILLTLLFHVVVGALQGVLAFTALTLVSIGGALLRLLFAVGVVWIGWRVSGVLAASVFAQLVVYGFASLPLRRYMGQASVSPRLPRTEILKYTGPVFVVLLGITSFFSTDVILAKHYLSAAQAGQYSGFSLLARVVYFASIPLISVMFPLTAQRVVQRRSTRNIVMLSLGIILLVAASVSTTYFLWPNEIIRLSLGHTYLGNEYALGFFALTLGFVSISSWLMHYLLAHNNPRVAWTLPVAAVLQILLISRYHGDIAEIVLSSLTAASLLVVSLALYTLWWFWHQPPRPRRPERVSADVPVTRIPLSQP